MSSPVTTVQNQTRHTCFVRVVADLLPLQAPAKGQIRYPIGSHIESTFRWHSLNMGFIPIQAGLHQNFHITSNQPRSAVYVTVINEHGVVICDGLPRYPGMTVTVTQDGILPANGIDATDTTDSPYQDSPL